MVGFDPHRRGLLLSGGSMANFAGLATALRASTDVDLNQRGRGGAYRARRASTRPTMTHMSMPKAAAMLGLGRDAIVRDPGRRATSAWTSDALRAADSQPIARPAFIPCAWWHGGRRQHRRDRSARRDRRCVRSARGCGCTSTARTAASPRWRRTSSGALAGARPRRLAVARSAQVALCAARRRVPAGARTRRRLRRAFSQAPATSTSSPIATCRSSPSGTTARSCRADSGR